MRRYFLFMSENKKLSVAFKWTLFSQSHYCIRLRPNKPSLLYLFIDPRPQPMKIELLYDCGALILPYGLIYVFIIDMQESRLGNIGYSLIHNTLRTSTKIACESAVNMNNTTCASHNTFDLRNSSQLYSFVYMPNEWILHTIAWPLMLIFGVISNTTFISTVVRASSLHTATFLYLVSLACSDLLTLVTLGPQ